MRRLFVLIAALCAAFAAPAAAQRMASCPTANSCHGRGEMAMSGNGAFIAFTVMGHSNRRFVLLETATRRATIVEGPAEHASIGDLSWSADGDELTFLTYEQGILSGGASHVWRLRPTSPNPDIQLLAIIPCVRSPVLSADGARLAVAEGILPDPTMTCASASAAFAIYERALGTGAATRRTEGQSRFVQSLFYDRADALYIGAWYPSHHVVYPSGERATGYWADDPNLSAIGPVRIAPGETMPIIPTPMRIGAHGGMHAYTVLNDGRLLLSGQLSPSQPLDWYDERGRPRTRSRPIALGFVAIAADGTSETITAAPFRDGFGRTGGYGVSADTRVSAQVTRETRRGLDPRAWNDTPDLFELYGRGALVFEADVATLIANAPTLTLTLGATPIMPITNSTPRLLQ